MTMGYSVCRAILAGALAALALQGCAWVKPTPEGENIRLLGQDEVGACTHVSTTTATLKHTIAGFHRNEAKVQRELATLARNAASELGGDTVVPTSEPEDERQTFEVYRCMP